MRLIHALHKSPLRAAIYEIPHHQWNRVIVEWGPHQYTTEIHTYDLDGTLNFQIVGYKRVTEKELRLQLGEAEYFSDKWKPYATPTPADIQGHRREIRRNMPPRTKRIIPPSPGYTEILREIFS